MADMTQQSLVDDLEKSIHQAAEYFPASRKADFIRLLEIAALAMSAVRPLLLKTTVDLAAHQIEYPAPANIIRVTRTDWGRAARKVRKPYNANYIHDLPNLSVIETATGTKLELSREMTASELADIGVSCPYFYQSNHTISITSADTTIKPADRGLLILRAQAEAAQELAFRQIGKPVSLRTGVSGQPKNGTPAALSKTLLDEWHTQAKRLLR